MPVEDAADRAVFVDPDEFGGTITSWAGSTVSIAGIFDAPWMRIEGVAAVPLTSARTTFTCASSDLPPGAAQGDDVVVGSASYKVRELQPDGTGMVTLDLDKA